MQEPVEQIAGTLKQLAHALMSVEPRECPAIIGNLEQLKALAWSRMTTLQAAPNGPVQPAPERYLSVKDVAERFHVTPKWLYKHKKNLPHSQPSRKILLFPEGAIQRWFAGRKRP